MAITSKESPKRKRPQSKGAEFSLEEIRELLEVLSANEVTEFALERGEEKISLKRKGAEQVTVVANPVAPIANPVPTVAPEIQAVEVAKPVAEEKGAETEQKASAGDRQVVSPMVGTFYSKPAPDASPYVQVGDRVKKGQVLCIVEAMKIMNEIESDESGVVTEVCLEDGQMVEYGETLFRLDSRA